MAIISCLVLGAAIGGRAQTATAPNKVGVIHVTNAISGTQQGQKALAELQARYNPRRQELEKRDNSIAGLRDQLVKGSNTMSDEARSALLQDIDQKTKALNRDLEYAESDYQQDLNRLLGDHYQKLLVVIDKYARDNGFSLILDIGSAQTPVVYRAEEIDITDAVVALFDKAEPVEKPAAAPAKAPAPAPAKK